MLKKRIELLDFFLIEKTPLWLSDSKNDKQVYIGDAFDVKIKNILKRKIEQSKISLIFTEENIENLKKDIQ